jgi:hypothetical protein
VCGNFAIGWNTAEAEEAELKRNGKENGRKIKGGGHGVFIENS